MTRRDLDGIDLLTEKRIIFYFNEIRHIKDITEIPWGESGLGWGVDYGIGEKVAHNIIEFRKSLPRRRFTSLQQILEVPGLGYEKIDDILNTLRIPSAEAFRRAMYRHVITDNFTLSYYAITFETPEDFKETLESPEKFKQIVSENIHHLVSDKVTEDELQEARQQILSAYVETISNGYLASYAFARWFFTFDLDNWFEFDQVREITEQYLDISFLSSDEQTFQLFKGFENNRILKEGRTILDLPVITNWDEKIVYVWMCQLID